MERDLLLDDLKTQGLSDLDFLIPRDLSKEEQKCILQFLSLSCQSTLVQVFLRLDHKPNFLLEYHQDISMGVTRL